MQLNKPIFLNYILCFIVCFFIAIYMAQAVRTAPDADYPGRSKGKYDQQTSLPLRFLR